ncbi:hypothetical protein HNQ59_000834 [Chitinivorax tropicus]|uniref:Uncharacterized protein n=1 Tax=Chitinivorax tropicus TaxID=714531 RepID=A0A840MJ79_9PROT|nr:hypothetical protein [Chitinivorax tropicus]MBB5017565.1 hypothetical protein [Chitinivorax tropicus]
MSNIRMVVFASTGLLGRRFNGQLREYSKECGVLQQKHATDLPNWGKTEYLMQLAA